MARSRQATEQGAAPWLRRQKTKNTTPMGFEPMTFCLGGRRAIHCTKGPCCNHLVSTKVPALMLGRDSVCLSRGFALLLRVSLALTPACRVSERVSECTRVRVPSVLGSVLGVVCARAECGRASERACGVSLHNKPPTAPSSSLAKYLSSCASIFFHLFAWHCLSPLTHTHTRT